MKNFLSSFAILFLSLVITTGCRTDQSLFAWGAYTGIFAVAFAIGFVIYVVTKIL